MKLAVNVDMEKLRRLHCPPKFNNNSIPNYLVVYMSIVYMCMHLQIILHITVVLAGFPTPNNEHQL